MATNRKATPRRGTTLGDSNADRWLRGDKSCGFFQFKHDDELIPLWEAHGDTENFFWRRGMGLPITLEDLKGFEDLWLDSGADDKYGGRSYFIYQNYSDSEKQELWDSRGDHESYYWQPGMRSPEAVE